MNELLKMFELYSSHIVPTTNKTTKEIEADKRTLIEIMTNQLELMSIEAVVSFSNLMFKYTQKNNR